MTFLTGLFPKYVLCRPRGGLNDTLCQIEKCWDYAAQTRRTLIIDARHCCFHDPFSSYFEPRTPSNRQIFDPPAHLLSRLNRTDCEPKCVKGRLDSYWADFLPDCLNFVDGETRVQLTFDFTLHHQADVLLHDQCGGSVSSFLALEKLRIAPALRPLIMERLAALPSAYNAIHIRNTDYESDYQSFIARLPEDLKRGPLLICSDDPKVAAYARSALPEAHIVISSHVPDLQGAPLHGQWSNSMGRRQQSIDMLVDLFALGRAKKLLVAPLTSKGGIGGYSGFSILAHHLNQNQNVIDELLGLSGSAPISPEWKRALYELETRRWARAIFRPRSIASTDWRPYEERIVATIAKTH